MATEQDHTWSILDDMLVFLSGQGVPTPERTYKFDGGWTLAMADLRKHVTALRAQLAAANQHAEYQDKEIRQWANVCYVGTWPLSEEDTKNTGFYGRMAAKMTAERNAATARAEKAEADLKAANERAEKAEAAFRGVSEAVSANGPWACFHCGFITGDEAEAKAHFGDRDEEEPLCLTWHDLDADGRASEYQSALQELDGERKENDALRTKIEGLEYRVDGQLSAIHSFAPFRKCSGISEVFHVYDSMEGRALAAEAERDALAARVAELEEALGDLREAMERAKASVWDGHYGKGITVDYARAVDKEISEATSKADKALARTPAQSLAKVQAAALRELRDKMLAMDMDIGAEFAEIEASRLEAEAAHGTT